MPIMTRAGATVLRRRGKRLTRMINGLHADRAEPAAGLQIALAENAELVDGLRRVLAGATFVDEAENPIHPDEEIELVVQGSTLSELRTLLAKHEGNGSAE